MDICVMINRVVHSYIHDFPEVTHNAYGYFGYDKPVVEERVNRGDPKIPYYTAKDFSDPMYQALIASALTKVNPILEKYSKNVAYEDALHMAIRSEGNGVFDGKINANCFNTLITAMLEMKKTPDKESADKKEKPKEISRKILKEIGFKPEDVSHKGKPHKMYRERGKVLLEKKDQ